MVLFQAAGPPEFGSSQFEVKSTPYVKAKIRSDKLKVLGVTTKFKHLLFSMDASVLRKTCFLLYVSHLNPLYPYRGTAGHQSPADVSGS